MPVTFAHPLAVLPLRGLGLPTVALVVGSVTPDVPLLTGGALVSYDLTHSVVGVLVVAPLLAATLVALWLGVVRDPLVDLLPDVLRERLPAQARLSRRETLLVLPAALLGAATHVVWDSFTHRGRWGVDLLPFLDGTYGPLPGYRWAQYGSGALGTLVLTIVVTGWFRRRPRRPRTRRVPALGPRALVVAAIVVGIDVASAVVEAAPDGLRAVGFDAAIAAMATTAAVAALLAALWWLLALVQRERVDRGPRL